MRSPKYHSSRKLCQIDGSYLLLLINPFLHNPREGILLKTCCKKEKNPGNQDFLLFPPCFLPLSK